METIEWQIIVPNESGDWTSQRNSDFEAFTPMGEKKSNFNQTTVFTNYSLGITTSRDVWCYNYSRPALESNMHRMIDTYNHQVDLVREGDLREEEVDNDPSHISWNRSLRKELSRKNRHSYTTGVIYSGMYRPFCKQFVYFDRVFNDMVYQLPSMFPTPQHMNYGIVLTAPASHFDFTPFMVDVLPNYHTLDTAQFFPRWTYEQTPTSEGQLDINGSASEVDKYGYRRVDNITPEILDDYRTTFGTEVTADDVFYYVYGLLHSPDYRTMYTADLTKMLPRIPKVATSEKFFAFARGGRQLADLHLGYETVEAYPLTEVVKDGSPKNATDLYRVIKMKYGSGKDKTKLIYNSWITLERIPAEAHEYMLGPRSGIDWLIDRYQLKADKKSGITNDPNDWASEHGEPRYILDLIKRVTTVSVRTVELVAQLPKLGPARP